MKETQLPNSYQRELIKFENTVIGRLASSISTKSGQEYLDSTERKIIESLSFVGLLGLFGVTFPFATIFNNLETHAPLLSLPFYISQRLSGNRGLIQFYKFRTIRDNPNGIEEDGALATHPNQASRITKIGRFLRSTDLDESAQVINVWRREMSVLGSFRARSVKNTHDVAASDPKIGQLWHDTFLKVPGAILTLAGLDPDRKTENGRNINLDLWEHEHSSLLIDLFKINYFLLSHLGIKSLSHLNPLQ